MKHFLFTSVYDQFIYKLNFFSSDGPENIVNQLLSSVDKSKKRKLDNSKMSIAVIENVIGLPLKKKKNSEKSDPSTSSNTSDSDTEDSSGKCH